MSSAQLPPRESGLGAAERVEVDHPAPLRQQPHPKSPPPDASASCLDSLHSYTRRCSARASLLPKRAPQPYPVLPPKPPQTAVAMATTEKSHLKRGRVSSGRQPETRQLQADDSISQQSQGEHVEPKKPRRSGQEDQSPSKDPNAHLKQGQLPSPITQVGSNVTDEGKEGTVTPPNRRTESTIPSQIRTPPGGVNGLSSPPQDTQPFSQYVSNKTYAVDDEEGEGVWGYLVPLDTRSGEVLVLRRRSACPVPSTMVGRTSGREKVSKKTFEKQEEKYEKEKANHGVTSGGYLIGRHPECGESRASIRFCRVTS